MKTMHVQNLLTDNLKKTLKTEISSIKVRENVRYFVINRTVVDKFARELSQNKNVILRGIACFPREDFYKLVYVFSFELITESSFFFVSTRLSKKVNTMVSIRESFVNAEASETRINNLFDIDFVLLDESVEIEPVYNPISLESIEPYQPPHLNGIFNPIHGDAFYFEGESKNNKIIKLNLADGFLHKRILKRINKSTPEESLRIVQEIALDTKISYLLGLSLLYEEIFKIDTSNRIKYIRMFRAEFERIVHHVKWFIDLFFLLQRKIEVNQLIEMHRELVQLEKQYVTPVKKDDLPIEIGGCHNISPDDAIKMLPIFDELIEEIFSTLYRNLFYRSCKQELSKSAVIKKKQAIDYGICGPALRASGLFADARYTNPYLRYIVGGISNVWSTIALKNGDNFSRAQARLWELKESWKICKYILNDIAQFEEPTAPRKKGKRKYPKNKMIHRCVEGPRGPIAFIYDSTSKMKNLGAKIYIIPPSLNNFYAIKKIIKPGAAIWDLKILTHTLDVNFNELDL